MESNKASRIQRLKNRMSTSAQLSTTTKLTPTWSRKESSFTSLD